MPTDFGCPEVDPVWDQRYLVGIVFLTLKTVLLISRMAAATRDTAMTIIFSLAVHSGRLGE